MRVLQFVCDGAPGGGTNHVLQVLRGMPSDVESSLLTQQETYIVSEAANSGVDVFPGDFFRSRIDRSAVRRLAMVIESYQPDLIHCHGGRAAFFRSFVKNTIPTIYTVHGFHFAQKGFVGRKLGWAAERRSIRHCDHVVFVSDFDRKLAERSKLLPPGKPFTVIHNGIPVPKPTQTGSKLGVGFIGRLVFQKNPQLFVNVMEQLPGVQAVLIGGGELESEIRELIKSKGLTDQVQMLGEMGHVDALNAMSRLDALVMTPRWEGLPLLPLEAMCMGVPVVSTSVGGVPEVVVHEETGLLGNTATELAQQIRRLTTDLGLRDRLVTRAAEVAMTEFSQSTMLTALSGTYRDCLAATTGRLETCPTL